MSSLLHSAGSWSRPRIHAAVGRSGAARSRRPRERGDADGELERARRTERAQFAQQVDIELRVACRTEAAARHELGIVARALCRGHAYRRLGFVRLSDYARERLGVSARTLHAAAWVATRLDALPIVAAAFDRAELSWAQVRTVCAIARPEDQEQWLARTRTTTVEELERIGRAVRPNGAGTADPDPDDGTIDGEPALQLRIACPARVRALWQRARARVACRRRAARGVARRRDHRRRSVLRTAGGRVARRPYRAGVHAARPPGAMMRFGNRRALPRARTRRARARTPVATAQAGAAREPERSDPAPPRAVSDPFALDARLVAVMRAIRTSEPRIGRLLRIVVDQHLYRAQGFPSLADYVRERLGISVRKAWALLKVERSTRRADDFAHAYDEGAISWVCALTLLPVVDRANAAAWIARADAVTVRRLADEVSWVLEARDVCGAEARLDPPPLDSVLVSPVAQAIATSAAATSTAAAATSAASVQIGAHAPLQTLLTKFDTGRRAAFEVCDVEIEFIAPVSVVALFREALDAYAEPGAPRWLASSPLPVARRRQRPRESHRGLRVASPARDSPRHRPRVGNGAARRSVAARRPLGRAAPARVRRRSAVPRRAAEDRARRGAGDWLSLTLRLPRSALPL
ncbi:MAG: hypothetical protein HY271_12210 [Deltaproteobacteria bacterium]|nr:hypothetical protein [Deltaproteobacteria bacterium]